MLNKRGAAVPLTQDEKSKKISEARELLAKLGEDKALIEADIKRLQKVNLQYDDVSDKLDEAEKELESIKTKTVKYEKVLANLEVANGNLIDVRKKIKAANLLLETLTAQIPNIKKNVEQFQNEYDEKVRKSNDSIIELESSVKSLEAKKSELNVEIVRLEEQKNSNTEANEIERNRIDNEIVEKTKELSSLTKELDEVEISLDNAKSYIQSAPGIVKKAKGEAELIISKAQSEADEIISKANAYKAKVDKDLDAKLGDISLREKWLKEQSEKLLIIKEGVEALHGKQIKSLEGIK